MKKGGVKGVKNQQSFSCQEVQKIVDVLFERVHEDFQILNVRLQEMEKRCENIEARSALFRLHIDERFDALEERSNIVETRVDVLAMNLDGLARNLQVLGEEQRAFVNVYKKYESNIH